MNCAPSLRERAGVRAKYPASNVDINPLILSFSQREKGSISGFR